LSTGLPGDHIPDDAIPDETPPGTPPAEAADLPDVWCLAHGVRWQHRPKGYVADDAGDPSNPAGHDQHAAEATAIPCGEIVPYDPAEYPNAGPVDARHDAAEVEQVRREVEAEMPPSLWRSK
jgi:hypothetical protein